MKIPIHFDGLIYDMQPHGGITRFYQNMLDLLGCDPRFEVYLHRWARMSPDSVPKGCTFKKIDAGLGKRCFRMMLGRKGGYGIDATDYFFRVNGVFHSTYYTTYKTPKARQVLTLHDMIYEDFPQCFPNESKRVKHFEDKKRCIKAADVIVCDSHATVERLWYYFENEIGRKPVRVIYLGLTTSLSTDTTHNPFKSSRPVLLHVGNRMGHKNFLALIRAMSRRRLAGYDLLTIGGGPWSAEESAYLECTGMVGRVSVWPSVDDDLLAAAYEHASAVVVPSLSEGFGLPLLEALGRGCRVASSNGGSLPEVGGQLPFYFDPLDEEEMVNAISRAIDLPRDSGYLKAARNWVQGFSWKRCANEYSEVYASLCSD